MSEQAGKTLIEQFAQFEYALKKYAAEKNWVKVERVNDLMIKAITQQTQVYSAKEKTAFSRLRTAHQQVLAKLMLQKDEVEQKMQQFHSQKDGLEAYQLTQSSQYKNDNE